MSVGGTLSWLVAGTDERVEDLGPHLRLRLQLRPKKTAWGFPEPNPALALFNRVLAPEAYASSIRGPVLFLGATNDFHGWMDDAYRDPRGDKRHEAAGFHAALQPPHRRGPGREFAGVDGLATARRSPLPDRSRSSS